MQRHKLMTAVLIYAAAAVAAVVPASASPSVGSQPSAHVVIVDCFSKPQVRPSEFLIACGDGNSSLIALKWTHWGSTSATGRGLNVVNDCKPYCAAGKFHNYPVMVRLERPEAWPQHPEQQRYTQLHLVYTEGRPEHTTPEVTIRLWP
ncbi:hypothetical protein ACFU5O_04345 [Streptomyces sp. NPDC057445]|uniref:hypothetical protein n=1 Tax=Streptomyces sp. NPDC057445 TaxID=3346136 RepID=UPI0036BD0ECE